MAQPENVTKKPSANWRPLALGLTVGLPIIAMGLLFMAFLWKAYLRAKETRAWVQTPCVVEHSGVDWKKASPNSPIRYHVDLRYRYQFEGESYTSTRIERVDRSVGEKPKMEKAAEAYPKGATLNCYVDPTDPSFAILKHGPLAPLYSIWFPALFVVGGIGIVLGSIRRSRKQPL